LLDLALLYLVGAIGWAMRVYDIPLVAAVMGLVLGPLAELQFRRTLAISQGDMSVFATRPVCALSCSGRDCCRRRRQAAPCPTQNQSEATERWRVSGELIHRGEWRPSTGLTNR
jgi:hypothetical protein